MFGQSASLGKNELLLVILNLFTGSVEGRGAIRENCSRPPMSRLGSRLNLNLPSGTIDNSPAIYCRVWDRKASRPSGTLERWCDGRHSRRRSWRC